MANENGVFVIGHLLAENDLSGKQYYLVEISGNNQVDVCDGATDKVVGILQNKPVAGQACEIMVVGMSKLLAGSGDLAAGDLWGTSATGTGIAKSTDKDHYNGLVLDGALDTNYATVLIGCGPFSLSAS